VRGREYVHREERMGGGGSIADFHADGLNRPSDRVGGFRRSERECGGVGWKRVFGMFAPVRTRGGEEEGGREVLFYPRVEGD